MASRSGGFSGGSGGEASQDGWFTLMFPYMMRTLLHAGIMMCMYYMFSMLLQSSAGDPGKFEIKMAKDID